MKPNKHTWKEFCQEPELSREELAAWGELVRHVQDDGFFDFMVGETRAEWQAAQSVELTKDWADLVAYADANRRLKRAEIVAWQEWQAEPRIGDTIKLKGSGKGGQIIDIWPRDNGHHIYVIRWDDPASGVGPLFESEFDVVEVI